jgi:hypothetical protein
MTDQEWRSQVRALWPTLAGDLLDDRSHDRSTAGALGDIEIAY